MNPNDPCQCPKCGWLGTYHDTEEFISADAQFEPLPARHVCPRCAVEVDVQTLSQKGLDGLRGQYALLLKGSYMKDASAEQRVERQSQLERFFKHIDQPLKPVSDVSQNFREMMASGRINELASQAVQDGLAATQAARSKQKPHP